MNSRMHLLWQRYLSTYQGLSREMWLLALVTFINRAGAMVLPFLGIYLTAGLGFELSQTGWIMAAYGLGSVSGNYIGGWLTDRWGYYPVMLISLLVSAVLFVWFAQLSSFVSLCAGMYTLSMIADAFRPASMAATGAYSKEGHHARSISLIRLAINLGFAAGPAAAGLLAGTLGYAWLFYLDGMTCLLAGLVFWLMLRPRTVDEQEESPSPYTKASEAGLSAYRNLNFLWYIFFIALFDLVFIQLFVTYPVFLEQELSLTLTQVGLLMSMNGVLIVMIEMPLTHALEGRFHPLLLVVVSMLIMSAGVLLLPLAYTWLGMLFITLIIMTVSEMIFSPFGYTHVLQVAPPARRGQYMGLYGMMFSISHMLAPPLGFQLAEKAGFVVLWSAAGVLAIIAAAGIYRSWQVVRASGS